MKSSNPPADELDDLFDMYDELFPKRSLDDEVDDAFESRFEE